MRLRLHVIYTTGKDAENTFYSKRTHSIVREEHTFYSKRILSTDIKNITRHKYHRKRRRTGKTYSRRRQGCHMSHHLMSYVTSSYTRHKYHRKRRRTRKTYS